MKTVLFILAILLAGCESNVRIIHTPAVIVPPCVFEGLNDEQAALLDESITGKSVRAKIDRNQARCDELHGKNKAAIERHNEEFKLRDE